MTALLFLFGNPGVGKSYIGRMLEQDYGFHYYDADEDLTPEMLQAIKKEHVFTEAMRENYYTIITKKVQGLQKSKGKLVVTQALIKIKNRKHLLASFPSAKFVHITADTNKTNARLKNRGDWVSIDYANKIRDSFEAPQIPHIKLDNNYNNDHVKTQLEGILG